MNFKSEQIGNRISECCIYLESKKDNELKEKYNYGSEECLVIDTLIKDGYQSYMGYGIYDNHFHKKYGIEYNILEGYSYTENEKHVYDITYKVSNLRKNDVEVEVDYEFTYKVINSNKRITLNKFIADLFKNGIIAELN